jgi:hypothetical protein
LWQLEVSQISVDAAVAEQFDIMEEAELLMLNPALTPEWVVELREKLTRATGCTSTEDVEPVAQSDAA